MAVSQEPVGSGVMSVAAAEGAEGRGVKHLHSPGVVDLVAPFRGPRTD